MQLVVNALKKAELEMKTRKLSLNEYFVIFFPLIFDCFVFIGIAFIFLKTMRNSSKMFSKLVEFYVRHG
jgi:amino acid permease